MSTELLPDADLSIAEDSVPGMPVHSIITSEWDSPVRQIATSCDDHPLSDDISSAAVVDSSAESRPSLTSLSRSLSQESSLPGEKSFVSVGGSCLPDSPRHVFVLSEAGKPIYTRCGSEEDITSLTGILQALVSSVQSLDGDELLSVSVGRLKFAFLCKSPLILVCVSRQWETDQQLQHQLNCFYNEIVFLLTTTTLVSVFEGRQNFDLRGFLGLNERNVTAKRTFENLLRSQEQNPAFLLSAVKCLPLPPTVRDSIGSAVASAVVLQGLVFVLLIAHEQLITIGRMRDYQLHPADIHLLMNLVVSNRSFRLHHFFPICLPRFDDRSTFQAHISYLNDSCPACLLMLTVERSEEEFRALFAIQEKLLEKLQKGRILQTVTDAATGFSIDERIPLFKVGLPELLHFLYKNRSSSQFTCPEFGSTYSCAEERCRLFARYSEFHGRMHSSSDTAKILYSTGDRESILGWVTSSFELYAVFSSLTTKVVAVATVEKLMKWLKNQENRLFITSPPLF